MYPGYVDGSMSHLALEHDFDDVVREAVGNIGETKLEGLTGSDRNDTTERPELFPRPIVEASRPQPRRAERKTPGHSRSLSTLLTLVISRRLLSPQKQLGSNSASSDGHVQREPWLTRNFTHTSNLIDNLRSRPRLRAGKWRAEGSQLFT